MGKGNQIILFFSRYKAILIGALCILLAFVAGIKFLMARERVLPQAQAQKIHYYGNPSIPVDHIHINVFYVVPQQRKPAKDWQSELSGSLKRINQFHQLQFLGRSSIMSHVHPDPIFLDISYPGGGDGMEADSVVALNESFKRAIKKLPAELLDETTGAPNEYGVTLLLFEGTLNAAQGRVFVFSRENFSDSRQRGYADSLLYHYFARTLGIPDLYDEVGKTSPSEGVMGLGRFRPLQLNFLGSAITKKMGLLE